MARPTVRKQLERPGGGSGARAKGRLRLVAAVDGEGYGYAGTANVDVAGVHEVTADATGLLSFTNVRPNSGASADVITLPVGTVYELTVTFPNRSPLVEHISVPDVTGPVWVKDCLTVPPDDLDVFDAVTAAALASALTGYLPTSQKAANNGVASLDSGGKVPTGQIPSLSATYLTVAQRAAASGVASLDSGTKVPVAQVPDLSATYVAGTQKAAANGVASLDSSGYVPLAQLARAQRAFIVDVRDYGAVADSSGAVGNGTDNLAAFNAAITAAAVAGVGTMVRAPAGKYRLSAGITITRGVLIGDGGGHPSSIATGSTVLVFDANSNGVTLTGVGACVRDVMLVGGGTTGNGLRVRASRTSVETVSIVSFGGHGYDVDSTSSNCNLSYVDRLRVTGCGGNGFNLTGGVDSNAGTFIGLDIAANTGWGIWVHAGARNRFVGGHCSTNTAGGVHDNGNSNMYEVYVESPGTFDFGAASSNGILTGLNYALPTLTGSISNAATSWGIIEDGAQRGQIAVSDVVVGPSGTRWGMRAGNFGAGWLDITNLDTGGRLMRADSAIGAVYWYCTQNPNTTAVCDLGTASLNWRRGYVRSLVNIPAAQTLAANGAVTIDAATGDADITLQANATSSTITNAVTGQVLRITWIQDATGGRTYAWPTNTRFADTAPSTTGASTRATATFRYDGTNWNQLAASQSSTLVDLSSPQTIGGTKTFSTSPVVPTPTTSGDAATKGYVDSVNAGDGWGIVRPPWAGNTTALVTIGNANSTWYYRVVDSATISKVRLYVGVQSGNVSVAAYSNTGVGTAGLPGTLLATSGSVACPAVGVADVSLGSSVAVATGDWLAVACDNTTATFAGVTGVGGAGLNAGMSGQQTASAFPCPTTPGTLSAANNRLITLIGIP